MVNVMYVECHLQQYSAYTRKICSHACVFRVSLLSLFLRFLSITFWDCSNSMVYFPYHFMPNLTEITN